MSVTILGAGVMGLTIATELTARGIPVSVVGETGPQACSWWAGGMLAPYCERESAPESVLRLGLQSIDWWASRTKVTRSGTLVVSPSRDQAELTRFARRTIGHTEVDAGTLEPDLAGRFGRALFFADEAHLSPRQALHDLAANLTQTASPTSGTIDCRGLSARDALHDLRGVRGEMLLIRCPDITLLRPVRLLHPRIPLYIVPRGDGVYMLGATMIESDRRRVVTARSLLEMLTAAYALHPAFAEAEVLELGADARPAFNDNLPRIRRKGRTIYANGLYRHGFLLSPAVAQMVADHIETGSIPEFMDENHD